VAASLSRIGRPSQSQVRALIQNAWNSPAARIAAKIGVFVVLFQAYKMIRQTFAQRSEDMGFDNAARLISWQRQLHLFVEPNVQRWALSHEWLIRALNWNYFLFMPAFYLCCAIGILFAPAAFRRLRRVFLFSMLLALPWYAVFPLAPPRFMTGYGLADTLQRFGPVSDTGGGMVKANQFAAMPSMHVGWTTIAACMLAAAIPNKAVGRTVGAALVAWMCLTVVATGNHYVLDILGGWMIVAVSFGMARLSERFGPFSLEFGPNETGATPLTLCRHRDKSIRAPLIRPEPNRGGQ